MTTYVPKIVSYYDVSHYSDISLGDIVKNVYGKTYDVNEAIYEVNNDTLYKYYVSTVKECVEAIADNYSSTLADWLADEVTYKPEDYGMATYLVNPPDPSVMLAHLVIDGHIPTGEYLINVSW